MAGITIVAEPDREFSLSFKVYFLLPIDISTARKGAAVRVNPTAAWK
jgi:hypothetical protein